MTNLEDKLDQIVLESGTLAKKIEDEVISADLSTFEKNAIGVGKAWSGSWLGYHSRVYYKDFQSPPAGAHFDPMHPLPKPNRISVSATTGKWVEYTDNDIWAKLNTLGNDRERELNRLTENAVDEMEEHRERLLSILNAANQGDGDKYLKRLIEDAERIKAITTDQFIDDYAPAGQQITQDEAAGSKGLITPLHITVLSRIRAIRSPFIVAAKVAKLAGRCKNHLSNLSGGANRQDATQPNNKYGKQMEKPRLFIGSSTEGKDIADMLQLGLDHDVEVTVWHQGVFGLSQGNLESLVQASRNFDFAALVLTPDDLTFKRDQTTNSPRDNVVFELGLFMGALGQDRTFMVYCRDEKPDLPSDLAGVTSATFAKRSDDNLQAALGSVCTQIKNAIKRCGFASRQTTKIPSQNPGVIVKDGVYYKQDGDGPFCTACYDTEKKLIRLTSLTGHFAMLGRWECNVCKSSYSGEDA